MTHEPQLAGMATKKQLAMLGLPVPAKGKSVSQNFDNGFHKMEMTVKHTNKKSTEGKVLYEYYHKFLGFSNTASGFSG